MIKVNKSGYHGILLPDLNIGLDYNGSDAESIFISHAHADHMPKNRKLKVHATPPTAAFMRLRGFKGGIIEVPFGETIKTSSANVTFYPAGHILGSAMTFVESSSGNVLYTGDYRTPPSPASEGFQLPEKSIDVFITEATFGLPIYKWDSHEFLKNEITSFAKKSLDQGYTPVYLAYNLGKAQEIMFMLRNSGLKIQIHGAGYNLCDIYQKHGFDLGDFERYERATCEGKVLITPSSALNNGFASNVKKKKIAYCSGWATMESRRTQLTVDKLIPLSDHLDFFELIDLCKKLNPGKVYITHTPNPKVLQHYLGRMKIESEFLDLQVDEQT